MSDHIAWAAMNIAASAGLAVAGFAAFVMWRSPRVAQPLAARHATLLAPVLWFLAADEGLELHDRVGRWLYNEHGIVAPGPINHVDDVIVLGYVAAAACVGLLMLPDLMRHPVFLCGLVASAALIASGTAIDALGTPESWTAWPEEAAEALGAVLLAAVMWRAWSGAGVTAIPDHVRIPSLLESAKSGARRSY